VLITESSPLRVGVVVVAYNAAATLLTTLDRIPPDFRARISEVIVCDDASGDDTFDLGRQWADRADTPPTHVIRHTKNLGYGGNQKAAYALAIEHGLDIVVLLHGDGQYAPEYLPQLIEPFEHDDWAAVFGSRMMDKGAARRGGMPLYKRAGNRILSRFENRMLGAGLTEFHSGYRAYRTSMLRQIAFEANSDGFDFDTQIIAQVLHAGGRIKEVSIPTYYGDEICYVNGLRYARDVVEDVLEYRLAVSGFGVCEWVPAPDEYAFKEGDGSSHAMLLRMLSNDSRLRVLDLGCSAGLLAEKMRAAGHVVVGIDSLALPGVQDRTDEFYVADLEHGLPAEVGTGYDVVVAGDVIEHLARPALLLAEVRRVLKPGGQLLLSVPNFGHWYPRLRVLFGVFGYDRRGILDNTHLRFFTRATLRRQVRASGFDVLEESATGLPLGAVTGSVRTSLVRRLDRWLVRARPTLFGYQHVLRLTPHAQESIYAAPASMPTPVVDGRHADSA
jgi:2-polyprenyl-3-methyl-5-hydroxy-6-metoxy-1,4-benzoquinol methylase